LNTVEAKVTSPSISARVQQTNDSSRDTVNRRDIAPFVTIAHCTGPGQVFQLGQAAVLAGDDVIGLVRLPSIFFVK
jgi:hypothetical protein